jgi:hypothetical protein
MKKVYVLTISIFIISSTNFILPNDKDDQKNNQSTVIKENQINDHKNNTDQNTTNCETKNIELDDELDKLSEDAEKSGVIIEPISKPSYLMNIVRKCGVVFFLKPYVFVVDNYRITKNFIIKYATVAWEKIVGKKPEVVTNGTNK